MFSVNKKMHEQKTFNPQIAIYEIGHAVYMYFQSDIENDFSNAFSFRLLPILESGRRELRIDVKQYFEQYNNNNYDFYDVFLSFNINSVENVAEQVNSESIFIHKITIAKASFLSYQDICSGIGNSFHQAIQNYYDKTATINIKKMDGNQVESIKTTNTLSKKYLSNTTFFVVMFFVIFGLFFIAHIINKDKKHDNVLTQYNHKIDVPKIQIFRPDASLPKGTINKDSENLSKYLKPTASTSTNKNENLNVYLSSLPSKSDVEKVENTPFQDNSSVDQQIAITKQTLKQLGLPTGADADTGCFSDDK
jgi:hypothetical protein